MSLASRYSRIASDAFGEAEPREVGAVDRSALEAGPLVARGDTLLDDDDDDDDGGAALKSELPGVDGDRWTQFARAMVTQPLDAVSDSNGVGLFNMTPRRLADLGLVTRLGRSRSESADGRSRAIWVAVFVPPMTCEKFLRSPRAQYGAFAKSIKDYDEQMRGGAIACDPEMSRSGALAILHRAGPRGLDTWRDGERFEGTRRAYDRVAGIF